MQHPYGLWNRSARTGFVTTSYVMHTLSRLYPDAPPKLTRKDFEASRRRVAARHDRADAAAGPARPVERGRDRGAAGRVSRSDAGRRSPRTAPLVRYWAMIALGARHTEAAVPALITG